MSLAIAPETPWGVRAPLTDLMPGTTGTRLDESTFADAATGRAAIDAVLRDAAGVPLVVVVRDVHRHAWMAAALSALIAARPDTIVVEMGVPASSLGPRRSRRTAPRPPAARPPPSCSPASPRSACRFRPSNTAAPG